MTEENIIKLTNALYKVTSLFPKEEPLKFAIRKESLDILFFSTIIKGQSFAVAFKEKEQYMQKAINKIDLLFTYFDIARSQEWVNERNFSVLEKEYAELRKVFSFEICKAKESARPAITMEIIEPKTIEPEKKVIKPESKIEKEIQVPLEKAPNEMRHINYEELSGVQLKVLEILQTQGQLKGAQINQFFPEANPRTIRREIKGLKELKIIVSNGGGKTTSYEINRSY